MPRLEDFLIGAGRGTLARHKEERIRRQNQASKLEQIYATGRAAAKGQQEFPDAQEQMNQAILKLIMQMIPREPTTAESVAAAPSTIVPGPGGSFVGGGEGSEVAAGLPSRQAPMNVIAGMGRPNVAALLEAKRMQAQKTLEALSQFGVGTLAAPRSGSGVFEALESAIAGDEQALGSREDIELIRRALAGDAEAERLLRTRRR